MRALLPPPLDPGPSPFACFLCRHVPLKVQTASASPSHVKAQRRPTRGRFPRHRGAGGCRPRGCHPKALERNSPTLRPIPPCILGWGCAKNRPAPLLAQAWQTTGIVTSGRGRPCCLAELGHFRREKKGHRRFNGPRGGDASGRTLLLGAAARRALYHSSPWLDSRRPSPSLPREAVRWKFRRGSTLLRGRHSGSRAGHCTVRVASNTRRYAMLLSCPGRHRSLLQWLR
jgi:hypothetical protein